MWICSTLGFYSIVRKGGSWHVRARNRRDLENLRMAANVRAPIIETPAADYGFRILVQEAVLRRIFRTLEQTIDYPNFKGEIGSRADQRDKLAVYHDFWSAMQR